MLNKILLFTFIIGTFSVFGQFKKEKLKIYWPEEYKWKTVYNVEDSTMSLTQIIPQSETATSWTIAGTIRVSKKLVVPNISSVIESYSNAALKESAKAKVTVLEKSDSSKTYWIILKTETSDFPNDPNPESDLIYICQGSQNHYAAFVGIREKQFSKEFEKKWIEIFKKSSLQYD